MIGTPRTIIAFANGTPPTIATSDVSTGTAVAITMPITSQKFKIQEVGYICTVAQTAAVATITVKRIKGLGVTAVDIGTFPIAVGTAIGEVVKASMGSFADTDIACGEWVTFTSDNGGDAGAGWFFIYGYEIESNPQAVVNFGSVAKDPAGSANVRYAAATET